MLFFFGYGQVYVVKYVVCQIVNKIMYGQVLIVLSGVLDNVVFVYVIYLFDYVQFVQVVDMVFYVGDLFDDWYMFVMYVLNVVQLVGD